MQLATSQSPTIELTRCSRPGVNVRLPDRVCWILQAVSLAAAAIWLCCDPAAERLVGMLHPNLDQPLSAVREMAVQFGWMRGSLLVAIAATSLGSFAWWVSRMSRRPQGRQTQRSGVLRSLKSLLIFTAFCAGWFALAANASSLVWQGKRARLAWNVERLNTIVEPLRKHWPSRDDQLPGIGYWMAYPFGKPSVLLLMKPPPIDGHLFVSAVQHLDSGALLLQLSGTPGNDWAEWHPKNSRPASFVGGLGDAHELGGYSSLGDGWYLVRYQT